MLAIARRGLAGEFGVTVPRGLHKLEELAALVGAEEGIPAAGWQAVAGLHAHGRAGGRWGAGARPRGGGGGGWWGAGGRGPAPAGAGTRPHAPWPRPPASGRSRLP